MSDSDSIIRLGALTLHFDMPAREVCLKPNPPPPGKADRGYRPVVLSFDELQQWLTARFMSGEQPKESP